MQQVTLNKNSWHYKYYSTVVGDYAPKSLCPYFWTMVILIILSPLFLIVIGSIKFMDKLINFFDKITIIKSKKEVREVKIKTEQEWDVWFDEQEKIALAKRKRWDNISHKFSLVFGWVIVPLIFACAIWQGYNLIVKHGIVPIIVVLLIILVFVGVIWGFIWVANTYANKTGKHLMTFFKFINPLRFKFVQIIGQMIKAWYTKACPLITWEGKSQDELNFIGND
jgi:predicted PurR-regulated permease PerM